MSIAVPKTINVSLFFRETYGENNSPKSLESVSNPQYVMIRNIDKYDATNEITNAID
jgi:hypothetical protein